MSTSIIPLTIVVTTVVSEERQGRSLGSAQVWIYIPALLLAQVVHEEWGRDLIGSWNSHGWFTAPQRVWATRLRRLSGAQPDEVVVTDSASVNLFKAAAAGLRLRPDRRVIVSGILGHGPPARRHSTSSTCMHASTPYIREDSLGGFLAIYRESASLSSWLRQSGACLARTSTSWRA